MTPPATSCRLICQQHRQKGDILKVGVAGVISPPKGSPNCCCCCLVTYSLTHCIVVSSSGSSPRRHRYTPAEISQQSVDLLLREYYKVSVPTAADDAAADAVLMPWHLLTHSAQPCVCRCPADGHCTEAQQPAARGRCVRCCCLSNWQHMLRAIPHTPWHTHTMQHNAISLTHN